MRKNENTVILAKKKIGSKVILVPYKPEHVPKYHEWMKSPVLQELTASEPLTLKEEYNMQNTWHRDEDKCTFIILLRPPNSSIDLFASSIKSQKMIGDVNLFLSHNDDNALIAEMEIMIAEENYRRGGLGMEALQLMLGYAMKHLSLTIFQAKISLKNDPSIILFTKKLGFTEVSRSEMFQEVTLEADFGNNKMGMIKESIFEVWENASIRDWE